jgi:hypothetical protein
MKVYKYELPMGDYAELELPINAEILTAQLQHNSLFIWAKVEPDAPTTRRKLRIAGTGHELAEDNLRYISTFFPYGGNLVFHVFEIEEE